MQIKTETLEITDIILQKPLVEYPELLDYIPHRPPIVMIDKLYKAEKSYALTGLTIHKDNVFCIDGKFTESGMIENIAQSAAAGIGVYYISMGLKIPLGLIGAVKKLTVNRLPEVGSTIYTEVKEVNEVFDISIIKGIIFSGSEILASCEMKVLIQKN